MAMAAGSSGALAQTSATIDISTTQSTPLNPNFSGFNDEVVFPVEYFDYRFNSLAAALSPGWVRYPSGMFSDAFNWQTGLMVPSWVAQFQSLDIATLLSESVAWVNGKGGGAFMDASNRAKFLGAKLIVCVNAYTDTPASVGQMAAFAAANDIPVAVWELANEPYLIKPFFSSGADYVARVKPYRDAIKAADPNAVVAVFFMDAGDTTPNPTWDQSIASYSDKYWDAVTYHHYPPQSTGPFSQWMADENGVLALKTSAYVTGHLAPLNPSGMKFLISEFNTTNDGLGTDSSLTAGTLYGAIYAAEYVMRMSSVPSMLHVGMHALSGTRGVNAATSNYITVQNAYNSGTTIDTTSLNFGFYTTAQPLGLAVLNGVLKNATAVLSTTVTGGATVPATGAGQMPALFAQAYANAGGQQSLVITNKSSVAHQVTVSLNGNSVTGTLPVEFIAGQDPSAVNTASNSNAVVVQTSTSSNPVTVPAYSVVRVDLGPGLAGSMAQIASAGGWDTRLTLVNLNSSSSEAQLKFFGNDGTTSLLPFTFPQQPARGTTTATLLDQTMNANATLVIDTTGPTTQTTATGSSQLLTSGNIGGFAIFKYTPSGQEAVVPLETRNAGSYLLAFDNTGQLATGLAIANLAASGASAGVVIRDDTGAQIGTGTITLPAYGHNAFMLTDSTYGFPATAGKRGTVEFDTPQDGRISVVGLRANGAALTTLPVLANVGSAGGSLAHVASGGGWQTIFMLVNTGTSPANATLNFFDEIGNALPLPLSFPQTGTAATEPSVSRTIPAGGTLLIVTQGQNSGASVTGSAQLTATGDVSGFAVFQSIAAGQEAVVPLEDRHAGSYVLAFDDTNALWTGIALSNITSSAVSVSVVIRDDTGAQIGTGTINLPAHGHNAFMLAGQYASTANIRGTVEFDTPSASQIAAIGIRATSTGAFTTVPVMIR
jgi:hypothetical protein